MIHFQKIGIKINLYGKQKNGRYSRQHEVLTIMLRMGQMDELTEKKR